MSLSSCCRALWSHPDLLASSALWGELELAPRQLALGTSRASLAAWLARRRDTAPRVRLVGGPPPDLAVVLATLGPAAMLVALELGDAAPATLLLLGRCTALTRLEAAGLGLDCVPHQVGSLALLVDLDLGSNDWLGKANRFQPLKRLAGLTRLNVAGCGLRAVPAELSSLGRLAELLLDSNLLGRAGDSAFAPLARLNELTRLGMAYCGLQSLPPQLSVMRSLLELVRPGRVAGG